MYLRRAADLLKFVPRTSNAEPAMYLTNAFKNGKSPAVRIPADRDFERTDVALAIERIGDEIRIRPARPSIAPPTSPMGRLGW